MWPPTPVPGIWMCGSSGRAFQLDGILTSPGPTLTPGIPYPSTRVVIDPSAPRYDSLAIVAGRREAGLSDDVLHDFAVDVGEAEIAARVAIGQALVIHSQQMQDGRVQVVN